MPINVAPQEALGLFIGLVLLATALTVALAGRRTPESLLLAVFLGLVGENFVAIALWDLGGRPVLGDPTYQLATLMLALDPFFLLAFATSYPYPRRTRGTKALLALVAATSALSALAVLLRPERTYGGLAAGLTFVTPERLLLIGNLVIAYFAAWILAVRTARDAPTPLLARRAAWMLAAVGVAVVPRLGLLPADFEVSFLQLLAGRARDTALDSLLDVLAQLVLAAAVAAGVFWIGLREARRAPAQDAVELRRAMRAAGLLIAAIFLANLGMVGTGLLGMLLGFDAALLGFTSFYGFRWLIFAGLLAYGILAYDFLELRYATDRVLPALGGFAGACGGFLFTMAALAGTRPGDTVLLTLSAAMAVAFVVPSAAATRALLRRFSPPDAGGRLQRGLHLYRAALEAAWAAGAPDGAARERLERDRRRFRVNPDAARALEHVVAGDLRRHRDALRPGDEPVPGVVIQRALGEGAHGRVFLALRMPSRERVVVKEIRALGVTDHQMRQHFLTEVRALEALDHPRIVRLLDARTPRDRLLLILQHLEGEPLDGVFAKGRVGEVRLRRWAGDILDALGAAHAQGVVHRDVKPSNILIGPGGDAYLTDFGVAVLSGGPAEVRATVTNFEVMDVPVGTLGYMAPEQARGQPVSPATDLYALGLVLYEGLTGAPALDLRGHTLYEALERAAKPNLGLDGVPPGWAKVLGRALHPDPAQRFPSAAAMAAELPPAADPAG